MNIVEDLIKLIENMQYGEESSISRLLGERINEFSSKELFQIYMEVVEGCKNKGIKLNFKRENQFVGLPYNISFVKEEDNWIIFVLNL